MTDSFSGWLIQELEQRGLSYRRLAERIGVSATSVTDLANEKMKPSPGMCRKIARAFNLPPEDIFRHAGLLPPLSENDDRRRLAEVAATLTHDDLKTLLKVARSLATATSIQCRQHND